MINTTYILICLCFAICLSLTAGGVLVVFRTGHAAGSSFRYLQYFLVMLHVFGYYSLWSNILIKHFADFPNTEFAAALVTQLGVPFFIISMVMLLVWIARMQEISARLLAWLPVFSFALSVAAYLSAGWTIADAARTACSLTGFTVLMVVAGIVGFGQNLIVKPGSRWRLALLASAAGIVQVSYLTPMAGNAYYEMAFALLFFLTHTSMAVLYTYQGVEKEETSEWTMETFLKKYGISKREGDIVREIYAGKTNQEIANVLFISLQTVKDHSSRIYQKTFVKNRAQLTTLVRESVGQALH